MRFQQISLFFSMVVLCLYLPGVCSNKLKRRQYMIRCCGTQSCLYPDRHRKRPTEQVDITSTSPTTGYDEPLYGESEMTSSSKPATKFSSSTKSKSTVKTLPPTKQYSASTTISELKSSQPTFAADSLSSTASTGVTPTSAISTIAAIQLSSTVSPLVTTEKSTPPIQNGGIVNQSSSATMYTNMASSTIASTLPANNAVVTSPTINNSASTTPAATNPAANNPVATNPPATTPAATTPATTTPAPTTLAHTTPATTTPSPTTLAHTTPATTTPAPTTLAHTTPAITTPAPTTLAHTTLTSTTPDSSLTTATTTLAPATTVKITLPTTTLAQTTVTSQPPVTKSVPLPNWCPCPVGCNCKLNLSILDVVGTINSTFLTGYSGDWRFVCGISNTSTIESLLKGYGICCVNCMEVFENQNSKNTEKLYAGMNDVQVKEDADSNPQIEFNSAGSLGNFSIFKEGQYVAKVTEVYKCEDIAKMTMVDSSRVLLRPELDTWVDVSHPITITNDSLHSTTCNAGSQCMKSDLQTVYPSGSWVTVVNAPAPTNALMMDSSQWLYMARGVVDSDNIVICKWYETTLCNAPLFNLERTPTTIQAFTAVPGTVRFVKTTSSDPIPKNAIQIGYITRPSGLRVPIFAGFGFHFGKNKNTTASIEADTKLMVSALEIIFESANQYYIMVKV